MRVFGCVSYVKIKDSERDKLDSKARKCTFIGYGGDEMGYRFWDNENKRIIRSRDVVFNEQALYKDTLAGGSSSEEEPMKSNEQVEYEVEEEEEDVLKPVSSPELGESSGSSGSSSDDEGEGGSKDGADGAEPVAPALRRSTRLSKPPARYAVNCLLLTENGEPESYPEALGMNNSIQWKKAMEEEMNSLDKNKTWFLVKLPNGKKAL